MSAACSSGGSVLAFLISSRVGVELGKMLSDTEWRNKA